MIGVFYPELCRSVRSRHRGVLRTTAEETHRFVGGWFQDDEIYEFIGSNIAEIPRHSIRYYTTSNELKNLRLAVARELLLSRGRAKREFPSLSARR